MRIFFELSLVLSLRHTRLRHSLSKFNGTILNRGLFETLVHAREVGLEEACTAQLGACTRIEWEISTDE